MDKKTKKSIFLMSIFILICAENKLFFLIPLPYIFASGTSNNTLLSLAALLISSVFFLERKRIALGYWGKTIIAMYVIVIGSFFHAYLRFGYRATQIIWSFTPFFLFLLYFPGKELLKKRGYLDIFIRCLEINSIIMSLLFTIQVFYYKGSDTIFLKLQDMIRYQYIYTQDIGLRIYNVFDGTTRVLILVAAYRSIRKGFKGCILDIVSFLAMLSAIIFVDRSRYYLMIVLLCCFIMYVKYNRGKVNRDRAILAICATIVGLVLIGGRLLSVIESITENTGSWYARAEGYLHFLGVFLKHPILGISPIEPEATSHLYQFVRGDAGIYFQDDIGMMGIVANFGLLGMLWFLNTIWKAIRLYMRTKKDKVLSLGILVALLLAIPLNSYLDRTRITSFVLTMLLLEINQQAVDGAWKKEVADSRSMDRTE